MINVYIHNGKIIKTIQADRIWSEYIDTAREVREHEETTEPLLFEWWEIVTYSNSQARLDRIQELEAKEDKDEYEQEELDYLIS